MEHLLWHEAICCEMIEALEGSPKPPLHTACIRGDLDAVDKLIQQKYELNEPDQNQCTALHYACSQGFVRIAELLISAGCKINLLNAEGYTPLHMACEEGHYKLVKLLLAHDCVLNSENSFGSRPIHALCKKGYYEIAKLLLESGHCDFEIGDSLNRTPLHHACMNNNLNLASLLLDHGAPVEHMLLYDSVVVGKSEVAKLLLSRGCDVNTAQDFCPLIAATDRGEYELVRLLLRYKCDVNKTDGYTYPIHAACKRKNVDLVKLFFNYGCDVNVKDAHGDAPIHIAIDYEFVEILKLLIEAGCDLNVYNRGGLSCLHSTLYRRNYVCTRLLLQAGCRIRNFKFKRLKPLDIIVAANPHDDEFISAEEAKAEFIFLLLQAGYNFSNESPSTKELCIKFCCKDEEEKQKFLNKIQTPGTLKEFCRIEIRELLGSLPNNKVKYLEIPHTLKDFLCYEDLPH